MYRFIDWNQTCAAKRGIFVVSRGCVRSWRHIRRAPSRGRGSKEGYWCLQVSNSRQPLAACGGMHLIFEFCCSLKWLQHEVYEVRGIASAEMEMLLCSFLQVITETALAVRFALEMILWRDGMMLPLFRTAPLFLCGNLFIRFSFCSFNPGPWYHETSQMLELLIDIICKECCIRYN